MRIPMKVDYGVRALVELALRHGEGPVQTADIAYRQGIPEAYLGPANDHPSQIRLRYEPEGPPGWARFGHGPPGNKLAHGDEDAG